MKKIKIGIIGCGKQGSHYVRAFKDSDVCPNIELVAIAENNNKRLNFMKERYKDIHYFDDAIKMLDSGLIDSCIVATPHFDHEKLVIECLKRGIHVLCEKPMAVYSLQARRMIDEASKHKDVVFGLMFNQRTNCLYRKVKEILEAKKYGNVRKIIMQATDWYRTGMYFKESYWHSTWLGEGGGILINQAMHNLDLWTWLFGMPDKVLAKLSYGKYHDIEGDDDDTVYIEYKNGTKGIFEVSCSDVCGTNRLEIQLDKARLLIENNKLFLREITSNDEDVKDDYRYMYKKLPFKEEEIITDGLNSQHEGILNDFADSIINKKELFCKGEEGINSLLLCNAIYLSSFLNKEVEIPFDEELYLSELKKKMANSHLREDARDSLYSLMVTMDDTIKVGYLNPINKKISV